MERLSKQQHQQLLEEGWKFTTAGLYEPNHAPRGTRFALVGDEPHTRAMRLHPPGCKCRRHS